MGTGRGHCARYAGRGGVGGRAVVAFPLAWKEVLFLEGMDMDGRWRGRKVGEGKRSWFYKAGFFKAIIAILQICSAAHKLQMAFLIISIFNERGNKRGSTVASLVCRESTGHRRQPRGWQPPFFEP